MWTTRLLAAAACCIVAGYGAQARAAETVVHATFGGITAEAQSKGLLAEAGKLGIQVNLANHGGWPGVQAHLSAGAPGWDTISIGFARCEAVSQAGWVQPIDYTVVDRSKVPPELARPNYVGMFTFSYGLAYNQKPGRPEPQSWADFWDVVRFPGRRALMAEGLYALEAALMADGVAPADVYALLKTKPGQDRAFAKLEQIKPHVAIWWRSPAQASQLLRDGEVDMILMTSSRAGDLVKEGSKVGFMWNQAFLDSECWMVPKNAPNPKAAMRVINSALDAENQARYATIIGFGPANPAAFKTAALTGGAVTWLPTAPQNIARQLPADQTWYASRDADAAYQRFSRMLQ